MFEPLPDKFSFPEAEQKVLRFWEEHDIFGKSLDIRRDAPKFVFYEGPPTANGLPHPGHCLTRAIKDLFPRYQTMRGHRVERKAGWDTHGLPVEVEVCKELGIHSKEEIEAYGLEDFNRRCIESVFRYTREWEEMTRRLGFWVNLEEAYVTYHQSYVESVWWGLKTLFERGLLYQGHKVVWWWAQGGTALSAGEVGEGYRTVDDPSVYVKFPLVPDDRIAALLGSIGVSPVDTGVSPVDTGVSPVDEPKRPSVDVTLSRRRRILPHWEAGGSTYFMTFRVESGELAPAERSLVLDACRHFDGTRYLLHAVVVMPDHVHLLWTPLERSPGEWWSIADLTHSIKSFTAKAINAARGATGPVWQREYYDRIIRGESDFSEKWDYVVHNPERRGMDEAYEWMWVEPSHAARPDAVTNPNDALQDPGDRRDADVPRDGRDVDVPLYRRDADAPRVPGAARQTRVSLLVWTTTPWTLISNHFAAVGPDIAYALVYDKTLDECLIIAEALVESTMQRMKHEYETLGVCKGSDLVGLRYQPPFPDVYWKDLGDQTAALKDGGEEYLGWRVTLADFVTLDSGTGLVHEAPAYGEVDFELLQNERQRFVDELNSIPLINAVAPNGTFNEEAPEPYRGRWVKDCDKDIIRELKERGLLLHQEQYRHEYPFCPRAENDPLIQYARKSWFVRTSQFKDEFLKNNAQINWLPGHIREGRFGDFLRNNVDWALSRERFWGTPLPVWQCEQTGQMEAIGSLEELKAKPGATDGGLWEQKKRENPELPDHLQVHRPYIDAWTYDSRFAAGGTGGSPARMRRVAEVIDCWWDAGSMPFAQWGFPHRDGSVETFTERFPADFISEAIDQTRGWFYGLLAISTLLFSEATAQHHAQRVAELTDAPPEVPNAEEHSALKRAGEAQSSAAERAALTPAAPTGPKADESPIAADYPLPYKTCIVLGHVMGEDGLKMSKRTKNYKEPGYIFDHYGADAMRWYFYSAQTPWTSVRFQEAAIRDAQREFLIRLYNVFSFFNIYANIDGFIAHPEKGSPWRPTVERGELDRWIISELFRTVRGVRHHMDRFENYPAGQRLNEFVDALSNWYVRRSRERFWRSDKGQDKWDAYHTLYGVLLTLSRLIAPFTPFLAETMFQNLRGTESAGQTGGRAGGPANAIDVPGSEMPISVHLCDYPEVDEALIDESLAQEMDLVRQIVSLGRAARTQAKLKVRQPLAQVEIILVQREHTEWLQAHADLIAEELNIKQVEFTTEAEHYVTYQIKPNFKALGPRFGKLAPQVAKALDTVDAADARKSLATTGEIVVDAGGQRVHLTSDEVEVRLEAKPGWSAAQGRAGVVVVKTELTDELKQEGLVRELIHHVQGLRKDRSLPYEARVTLVLGGPEEFRDVVRRYEDAIRQECLADRIETADTPPDDAKSVRVEGYEVPLSIRPN